MSSELTSLTGDPSVLAERFVAAAGDERQRAFRRLVEALQLAVGKGAAAGNWADGGNGADGAAAALACAASPTLDYTSAQTLVRIHKRLSAARGPGPIETRVAVLANSTSKQLVSLVELFLFAAGVKAEIHEADYGVFRQEVLDPRSQLYAFGPRVAFLATGRHDLARRPAEGDTAADVAKLVSAEQGDWSRLWATLHERSGCQIVQNNFVAPPWRVFANHERRQAGSLGRFIGLMNESFAENAPPYVTIHDVDHLAAAHGRWTWDDPRYFHQAKLPCAPECLVDYAHSVASLVAAGLGLGKKCLVLDLDNTLWGGVVGDDGLGGIRLGQGDPLAEAHLAFQQYVKALCRRGVILAVCSKNDEANAREVFEKHPEMALRLADISRFVANWDDKATNLRRIAAQLNIGLNSLVFVDDNPAERAIVRQLAPEVAVPELPDDVTGYVEAIERHRYFQVLSIATEDLRRTEYYRADAGRRDAQASAGDIDDFLRSLQMAARVAPVRPDNLERSAQLIQRSNQFNLTTRRRSASELLALVDDPAWITLTVSLADRFGDNGLISVVLARVVGQALEIDTWLMSCRVLKRGVEQLLLGRLARLARGRGLRALRGEYVASAKNALVREHYPNLGFEPLESDGEGRTLWELALGDGPPALTHFINEVKEVFDDGNDS